MLSAPTDKRNISYAGSKLKRLRTFAFSAIQMPAEKLIFVHPPKTGGTNLCFVADAVSHKNPTFKTLRCPVPRIPNTSPNLISMGWIGGLASAIEALQEEPDSLKDKHFISGHFPFGLHARLGGSAKYITLVRHPLERSLSSTNFDYQRGYVESQDAMRYLLEADVDNPQTRMLAGENAMRGVCSEETLALAKKNIETHFLLAGVTEETDEFIEILASIQKWGPLALSKSQVTGQKVLAAIPESLRAKLFEKHRFDLALYEWVKARWLNWKAANILQEVIIKHDEKIVCITSDFANSRKPEFLTQSEIEDYNAGKRDDALVEVGQKPHLSCINPAPLPFLPSYTARGTGSVRDKAQEEVKIGEAEHQKCSL